MELKKSFCSSPWFHMRITSDGSYDLCRWAKRGSEIYRKNYGNLKDIPPDYWFQNSMHEFRKNFINNDSSNTEICAKCYKMERYGKISGREKQLLKTGIQSTDGFEKTLASSPWIDEFKKTALNQQSALMPQDWQIDLGNLCNSGCVMCHPTSSSFLETEFKKINILNEKQPKSWTENPIALENFFNCLDRSPKISYMHFIGGEPLIMPAFKKILKRLVDNNLNKGVTIGFTTNLTVWDEELIEILENFPNLHIGLSIECIDAINDYVRYGSQITKVKTILDSWRDVSKKHDGWLVQIRTTPTLLTIEKLNTVYEYAWKNNMSVESCDFLEEPDFLRPTVLPLESRMAAIENLRQWTKNKTKEYQMTGQFVTNSRHPDLVKEYLIQDANSYINYLLDGEDESHLMHDLVNYLTKLEKSRKNSILDYIPHYELILKSFGYRRPN